MTEIGSPLRLRIYPLPKACWSKRRTQVRRFSLNPTPQVTVMNPISSTPAIVRLPSLAVLLVVCAHHAFAQQVPDSLVPDKPDDDVLQLSPFVVDAQGDAGYQAGSTLAGTRLRTSLSDVATPVQVVTKEMLEDTGSRNAAEILVYTTGTEVGGLGGNFSATGHVSTEGYTSERSNFKQVGTRVRGLAGADLTRDYFPTSVQFDSYNTERIEINRGANSALFGLGSPAGIINNSLIAPQKRTKGFVTLQTGQYGSYRASIDYNVAPGDGQFAVRVAGLYDHEEFEQEPAFSTQRRGFATASWDLPFFKRSSLVSGVTLRASYEQGERESRMPRTLPPVDAISQWFKLGRPTWDPSVDSLSTANRQIISHNFTYSLVSFFPEPDSSVNGLGMVGIVQTLRPPSRTTGAPIFATFAAPARVNTALALANGNPFIIESTLQDTSVFDFKRHLIDGPNKREFVEFDVFNVTLESRFLKDRLGVEFAYNTESTLNGAFDWLRGQNNDSAVHIDINTRLFDGTTNPNYGRPYLASKGISDYSESKREMKRGTAFYRFDFRDIVDSRAGDWLGRHTLTLAGSEQSSRGFGKAGFPYLPDGEITKYQGPIDVTSINNGVSSILSYLGPSVLGAASLADVRLSPVTVEQRPDLIAGSASRYIVWNPATNRWETRAISVFRQDPENILYPQSAGRSLEEIDSQVAVLQSSILHDTVVVTTSWRSDRTKSYRSGTPVLGSRGQVLADEINLPLGSAPVLQAEDETVSVGAVARAPKGLTGRWRMLEPFSVFINKSENFQPSGVRTSAYGDPISPPAGETKDFGFAVSLADGRLDLRTTWYETKQTGVSAGLSSVILGVAVLEARVLSRIAQGVRASDLQSMSPGVTQATIDSQVAIWNSTPWQYRDLYAIRPTFAGSTEYTHTSPPSVNDTYDLTSKGMEFEAVVNPLPTWRIAFNVAKQDARQTNTGIATLNFINERADHWARTGDLPSTPSISSNVRIDARALLANYYRVAARDGSTLPEVAKWRANFLTNYKFSHGPLKGLGIGGAYRWEDRVGVGYQTFFDSALGIYRIDPAKPLFAPRQDKIDGWVSYERALGPKVQWKLQLNVRNLANDDALVPIYRNPTGEVATARVIEGRRWDLSSRFEF